MDKIFLNGFLKGFSKTLGAVTCIGLIMVSEHIYKNYKYKHHTQNIIRKCVKDIDIDTKKDIVDVDMENIDENIVYDNENDNGDENNDIDENDENDDIDVDENKYDKLYNVYLESNRFKHLFDRF